MSGAEPTSPREPTEDLEAVARALAGGAVVGFPTETVYGLGASVRRPEAAAQIFALKSRPATLPLMLHVASAEAFDAFAQDVPEAARRLAEHFWPGPLTLIVPARPEIDRRILGGGDSVGLRAPDHPRCAALVEALGRLEGGCGAIAGTSGNRHAHLPATAASEVCEQFSADEVPAVLEGGPCSVGVESTVLRVLASEGGRVRLEILREGAISREALEAVAAPWLDGEIALAGVESRGRGRLRAVEAEALGQLEFREGDALFAPADLLASFGVHAPALHLREMPADPAVFAPRLYAELRALENAAPGRLFAVLPSAGAGELAAALRARLIRLSSRDED